MIVQEINNTWRILKAQNVIGSAVKIARKIPAKIDSNNNAAQNTEIADDIEGINTKAKSGDKKQGELQEKRKRAEEREQGGEKEERGARKEESREGEERGTRGEEREEIAQSCNGNVLFWLKNVFLCVFGFLFFLCSKLQGCWYWLCSSDALLWFHFHELHTRLSISITVRNYFFCFCVYADLQVVMSVILSHIRN